MNNTLPFKIVFLKRERRVEIYHSLLYHNRSNNNICCHCVNSNSVCKHCACVWQMQTAEEIAGSKYLLRRKKKTKKKNPQQFSNKNRKSTNKKIHIFRPRKIKNEKKKSEKRSQSYYKTQNKVKIIITSKGKETVIVVFVVVRRGRSRVVCCRGI